MARHYSAEFADWERDLYTISHDGELAAEQVRGLRDAAIKLGQQVGDTGRHGRTT